MMGGQTDLMNSVQNREAKLAEASAQRRSRMQQLLDEEDVFLSNILEKSTDDTSSLAHSISRQSKEMDAISAVITAIRQ